MSDIETRQKYMVKAEIAVEVANLVGIETYDPEREANSPADFWKEELRQIYEEIADESGEGLSQREMNYLMMQELDTELYSSYPYDLSRQDLKVIHRELVERQEDCGVD